MSGVRRYLEFLGGALYWVLKIVVVAYIFITMYLWLSDRLSSCVGTCGLVEELSAKSMLVQVFFPIVASATVATTILATWVFLDDVVVEKLRKSRRDVNE